MAHGTGDGFPAIGPAAIGTGRSDKHWTEMPRFYFDVTDGDSTLADDSGDDLADVREARSSALEVLAGLARQRLPDGDRHALSITVRKGDREVVYVATLTLSGEWKIDPDRGS